MIVPKEEELGDLNEDNSVTLNKYWHATILDVRSGQDVREDDGTRVVWCSLS